jgi:hypothetical protein
MQQSRLELLIGQKAGLEDQPFILTVLLLAPFFT